MKHASGKKSDIALSKEEVKQISKAFFGLRFSGRVDKHWGNPDGYGYEKTFGTMIKGSLQEIVQSAAGPVTEDRNFKKN